MGNDGLRLAAAPLMSLRQILERSTPELVSSAPSLQPPAYALSYDVTPMRTNYQKRRQIVLSRYELPVEEPEGAFYAFPSIKNFTPDSEAFCERAICSLVLHWCLAFSFGR